MCVCVYIMSPRNWHCKTLQHTATYCNTLQHTATHCNILHHTTTHCSTLQHTATHCNTLQHTATHCNTLQHTATPCNTLQCTATHCNTLQHARATSACCNPSVRVCMNKSRDTATHTATHCNTLQRTATCTCQICMLRPNARMCVCERETKRGEKKELSEKEKEVIVCMNLWEKEK